MKTTTPKHTEIFLAVLPFRILAAGEDIHPAAAAFTEDLITNFSKFRGLSVISRLSTSHIADATDQEAISRLHADYLVTGSFRVFGGQVQIHVQLIRTSDQAVVFANRYEETMASIFSMQDEITHQVVSTLRQYIDHDILSYSYQKKEVHLAAYEHWLRGMEQLRKGTLESDLKAREYFNAALKIAPNYARAYTGLSLSHFNEWSCQLWDRWEVSKQGAHDYALKALELDPQDYVSLAVLGRTYLYSESYELSESYSRKSLQMNPNDVQNLMRVAFSLMYLGYPEESLELYHRAGQLHPLHQDAYYPYASVFYFETGDFARAVELGKRVQPDTTFVDFPVYMAAACHYLGRTADAQVHWEAYLEQFSRHIIRGASTDVRQALAWHIEVNPYKDGRTRLQEFWNYMSGGGGLVPASTRVKENAGAFILRGEIWEITYDGHTIALKDAKGLHDIARMLAEPERSFHCLELLGDAVTHTAMPALDARAKRSYQDRIRALQVAIQEAEDMNDPGRAGKLYEEYDQLIKHLSGALGLSGRARKLGSEVEKARSAVTWRIRTAIRKMEKGHPALFRHLSLSIKTGTLCTYLPERPIQWEL